MKRLSEKTKLTLTKLRILAGATVIGIPNGVPWYYGNMATYLDSYIRDQTKSDHVNSQWILPMFYVFNIIAMGSAETLGKRFEAKKCIIFSALLYDLSLCLTYFTVGNSLAKTVNLGVIPGFTSGLMLSLNFKYVAMWFGRKRSGVASSIVSCSFGGGALLYNAVITEYVNPENLKPDVNLGTWRFFSQPELLARVPTICVTLGVISLCFHVPGLWLVRNPPAGYDPENRRSSVNVEAAEFRKKHSSREDAEIESGILEFSQKKNGNDTVKNGVSKQSAWTADYSDVTSLIHKQEEEEDETTRLLLKEKTNNLEHKCDYTPVELLKTRQFYVLWITVVVLNYGMILETTYYKQFGQVFIDNDDFLTATGIVASLFVCVIRIFFGCVIDVLDMKNVLVITLSSSSIFLGFWYWTAGLDRWLYMFWTSILGGIQSSIYIIFPMASLRFFGASYHTTNMALILSGVLFGNFVFPEVFSAVLASYGWVWLILLGSFLSLLGLALVVTALLPMKCRE